ncbi:hypothetical protein PROFUN_10252 [Planoprotostelium fungivorum]|uniref:Uncharacterized protein n=1 Tax=Planoprotostelium fungivorum TaxID=1890364 RepID=A0A2P6NEG5_9EUKA|nr:hypothetical protein PROFUN_10252 [Planoprotostelium fungivorum]
MPRLRKPKSTARHHVRCQGPTTDILTPAQVISFDFWKRKLASLADPCVMKASFHSKRHYITSTSITLITGKQFI